MAYRFVWRAVCGVIGSLGIAMGLIAIPLDYLIPLVLLTIVVGLTAAVGHESASADDSPKRRTSGQAAFIATLPCTGLLALAGLSFALRLLVVPLILALAVTSPPLVRWYGSQFVSAASPQPTEGGWSVITTAELCQQWHESYEALQQAVTPAARLRIVTARQHCLDELERRDPEGLSAWLSSRASAAGDPSRFLRMNQSQTPPADT
jgi:hypothetical protein